jgi:hypothetical protein
MPNPTPKKKLPMDLKSLARSYTTRAISTLGGIAEGGESEAARVAAAIALLDRGWGKPQQDNTHEVKGEIRVVLRKMLEDDDDKT